MPAVALTDGAEIQNEKAENTVKVVSAFGTCTGAVVDLSWVVTAASCFTANPAEHGSLADGKPELSAKVLLGKDASWRENKGIPIADLRRYPGDGRDLVLARLQTPVLGVTPHRLGTTAPVVGDELEVTGYGRTKSEWVPKQPHRAAFTIDAVDAREILVSGTSDAALCLGDSGAPAVRATPEGAELVALNSRSWQKNCIGSTGQVNDGAFATRLDDTVGWITGVTAETLPLPSFTDQQGVRFSNVATASQVFTWQLIEAGPNTFLLSDPETGRCLASPGPATNASMAYQPCDIAQTAQQFTFLALETKDTLVIRNTATGLLVKSASQKGKEPIQTATTNDTSAQWAAQPVMLTDRVAGATRWDTAVSISKAAFPGTAPVAYIANGENYVDAISAGSAAANAGGPLLLTPAAGLPNEVATELQRLRPSRVVFVGGTTVVPESIVTTVGRALPSATMERVNGGDRFETSRATVRSAFTTAPLVYLVDSGDWATALVGGNEAIHRGAPVIAVGGGLPAVDAPTAEFIRSLNPAEIRLVGDTTRISSGFSASLSGLAKTSRLTGADHYDLANRSVVESFTSASTAYLVSGLNYPDALSAGVLAEKSKSPVFYSPAECVKPATVEAITSLGVKKMVLIGGNAALTENVAALKRCA